MVSAVPLLMSSIRDLHYWKQSRPSSDYRNPIVDRPLEHDDEPNILWRKSDAPLAFSVSCVFAAIIHPFGG